MSLAGVFKYLSRVLFLLVTSISASATGSPGECIAFTGVTVVSTDVERVAPDQTVVVRSDRIDRVAHSSDIRVPKSCTIIDGRNRFLIPGLVDSHVHVYGPGVQPNDRHTQEVILSLLLANGVTTAINMLGSPEILALRDDLNRGKLIGPKLYTTGIFFESEHAYTLGPLSTGQPLARHKKCALR